MWIDLDANKAIKKKIQLQTLLLQLKHDILHKSYDFNLILF